MIKKGKLVVITGLDGSGTTSLGDYLHNYDQSSYKLQTPNGFFYDNKKQLAKEVRDASPEAFYHYYLASVIYASQEIEKKLKDGNVYCVRYLIDTVVSSRANGVKAELKYMTDVFNIVKPDLTIFIDINEETRQKRITKRGKNILDKTLDNSSYRKLFLKEFENYSNEFEKVDNNKNIEEMYYMAIQLCKKNDIFI